MDTDPGLGAPRVGELSSQDWGERGETEMWVLFLGCDFFQGLVQRRLNKSKVASVHSSVPQV